MGSYNNNQNTEKITLNKLYINKDYTKIYNHNDVFRLATLLLLLHSNTFNMVKINSKLNLLPMLLNVSLLSHFNKSTLRLKKNKKNTVRKWKTTTSIIKTSVFLNKKKTENLHLYTGINALNIHGSFMCYYNFYKKPTINLFNPVIRVKAYRHFNVSQYDILIKKLKINKRNIKNLGLRFKKIKWFFLTLIKSNKKIKVLNLENSLKSNAKITLKLKHSFKKKTPFLAPKQNLFLNSNKNIFSSENRSIKSNLLKKIHFFYKKRLFKFKVGDLKTKLSSKGLRSKIRKIFLNLKEKNLNLTLLKVVGAVKVTYNKKRSVIKIQPRKHFKAKKTKLTLNLSRYFLLNNKNTQKRSGLLDFKVLSFFKKYKTRFYPKNLRKYYKNLRYYNFYSSILFNKKNNNSLNSNLNFNVTRSRFKKLQLKKHYINSLNGNVLKRRYFTNKLKVFLNSMLRINLVKQLLIDIDKNFCIKNLSKLNKFSNKYYKVIIKYINIFISKSIKTYLPFGSTKKKNQLTKKPVLLLSNKFNDTDDRVTIRKLFIKSDNYNKLRVKSFIKIFRRISKKTSKNRWREKRKIIYKSRVMDRLFYKKHYKTILKNSNKRKTKYKPFFMRRESLKKNYYFRKLFFNKKLTNKKLFSKRLVNKMKPTRILTNNNVTRQLSNFYKPVVNNKLKSLRKNVYSNVFFNNLCLINLFYKPFIFIKNLKLNVSIKSNLYNKLISFNNFKPSLKHTFVNPFPFNNFSTLKKESLVVRSGKASVHNKYNNPFILSNVGFMFLQKINLNVGVMLKSKINRYKYSFFNINTIKRFFLKRSALGKLSNSFISKNIKTETFKQDKFNTNTFSSYTDNITTINTNFKGKLSSNSKLFPVFFFQKTQIYNKVLETFYRQEVRVKRIKFKPGYSRIWRVARKSLKDALCLTYKYQHRLTTYVSRYARTSKNTQKFLKDLTLVYLLLNSKFVTDLELSKELINSSFTFINGVLISNPNIQLFKGDFIQLVVHLKYYIVYRWILNWNIWKKIRLAKLARSKFKKKQNSLTKQKSFNIPNWVLLSRIKQSDIPKYLEVDFFTLSSFIVYEPFILSDFNPQTILESRTEIFNLYNWKYIN